jgi:hypothetical protein
MNQQNSFTLLLLSLVLFSQPAQSAVPPTIEAPTPGATMYGTAVRFSWILQENAIEYEIEISTSASFSRPFYKAKMAGLFTATQVSGFPHNGTTFYWRMRTRDAGGWSGFTATESFQSGVDPDIWGDPPWASPPWSEPPWGSPPWGDPPWSDLPWTPHEDSELIDYKQFSLYGAIVYE